VCDCGPFSRYGTRRPPCRGGDHAARTAPAAGSPRRNGSDSVEAPSEKDQAGSSAADHVAGGTNAPAWTKDR